MNRGRSHPCLKNVKFDIFSVGFSIVHTKMVGPGLIGKYEDMKPKFAPQNLNLHYDSYNS